MNTVGPDDEIARGNATAVGHLDTAIDMLDPGYGAAEPHRTRWQRTAQGLEQIGARDHHDLTEVTGHYADWAALSDAPTPDTVDALAADLTRFVVHAVTTDRTRTLARYALFLEAQTAPALLESLRRGHLRLTEWAGTMLGGLGADAAVTTPVVDYLEGVIMHRLGTPRADEDPGPQMRRMLAALIGPSAAAG